MELKIKKSGNDTTENPYFQIFNIYMIRKKIDENILLIENEYCMNSFR